jgi:DHA2 family multidrug resistance protein-like MFS transporter
MTQQELEQRDGLPPGQRGWAMLAIALGVGMASLDTAIANTALPGIAAQLKATPAASVWIINVYQLAMVATLLPLAALGEVVGYKRVAVWGLALFTVASLGCALAWSLPSLIVARLLQGVGGAALMGVNTALLRAVFPAKLIGRGFGFNSLVVAVAFAIGPTMASLILASASWEWLFGINVIPGIFAFFVAQRFLPATKLSGHRIDRLASLYNVGAFALLILFLGDCAHLESWRRLLPEALGAAVLFALLLRREAGHPAPLLPVDLFRRPLFALSSLTSICTFATQSLAFVSLPFYFETTLGRSPIETGFLMTPWAVMVAIMAPVAGRLSDRYAPGLLGGIGLAFLSAGMVAMLKLPVAADAFDIGWRMALCGMGFGFFQAPNLKAIMTSAPPGRAGGASGVVAISRLLGQGSGAALVAYCFTASSAHGASYALAAGAVFAAVASIASFSRLAVKQATF